MRGKGPRGFQRSTLCSNSRMRKGSTTHPPNPRGPPHNKAPYPPPPGVPQRLNLPTPSDQKHGDRFAPIGKPCVGKRSRYPCHLQCCRRLGGQTWQDRTACGGGHPRCGAPVGHWNALGESGTGGAGDCAAAPGTALGWRFTEAQPRSWFDSPSRQDNWGGGRVGSLCTAALGKTHPKTTAIIKNHRHRGKQQEFRRARLFPRGAATCARHGRHPAQRHSKARSGGGWGVEGRRPLARRGTIT